MRRVKMRADTKAVVFCLSAVINIILSNYGVGSVTWSAVFWVMFVSCKFSLQVTVVCGQWWNFVPLLSFWSGPELAVPGSHLDSSFSSSYFLSLFLFLFPSIFSSLPPLSVFPSHPPASLHLKPHIHSLSVSGEIPVDQRKWSHFLVVPRRRLHHTHTHRAHTEESQLLLLRCQHESIKHCFTVILLKESKCLY